MKNENFQQWLNQSTDLTLHQKKQAFNELSDTLPWVAKVVGFTRKSIGSRAISTGSCGD